MSEFWEMARVTLFGSSNSASRGGAAAFNPARDIPSLAGRVVLITGAAGDLGRQTAIELARYGRPARIYVADLPRDDAAKKALAQQITHEAYGDAATGTEGAARPTEIRFLDLDLASLASVRKCAADFVAQEGQLDILLLNAGIIQMAPRLTTEGYEAHFGINYLGHALLSRLLAPTLVRTAERQLGADVRIVVVSSEGHIMTPKGGIDFDQLKTTCAKMDYAKRYGQSKVALIGLMRHLSREYPQLKAVAIHPGRIITGMARGLEKESTLVRWTKPIAPLLCVPVAVGIRNHLWATTSPDISSGMYYEPVGVPGTESAAAKDESLLQRLREWTDNALAGIELLE
ncbi:NAD(P)-binding protein [Thozetella sp. PMI_491]|nr:NAD(P)-binding protein [Thozetella sp. PMI_491]